MTPTRASVAFSASASTGLHEDTTISFVGSDSDKPKGDLRPYANITLCGKDVLGLVDIGASVSRISAELAEQSCVKN